ncbi:MAG TPA: carboxypeptidase-like regulatory domain-containing protein, partial [Vicinamibacterales bacterium]
NNITIRLLHGSVIAGTVLGVTGRPQPGVQMTALQRRTVDGQLTLVTGGDNQGGFTDDQGHYRIWGLTPGDYVISAMPPAALTTARSITEVDLQWAAEELLRGPGRNGAGPPSPRAPDDGRVVSYAPVYYPGVVDPVGAATVTVGPSTERDGVDLALQVVPTATISGTVIGLDGEFVPSASVMLGSVSTLRAQGRASVRTDAAGRFVFQAVVPGDFTVAARASSHRPAAGVPPPSPQGPDLWARLDLTVGGEDQSGLVLALQQGMTVAGRLAFDGSSQPPADLSRVLISLTVTGANPSGATASQTRALADGAFALSGVAPGRYRLSAAIVGRPQASGRSQASWFLTSVMRDGQDLLDSALDVAPEQDVRDIRDLSVVFSDRQTDLAGTLFDSENHPVAGYVVLVFSTDRRFWTSDSRRIRQAPLGADGHFDISGLPAGEYFLGAVTHADADDVSDPSFLDEVAAAALRMTLGAGEHRIQDIRLGGR